MVQILMHARIAIELKIHQHQPLRETCLAFLANLNAFKINSLKFNCKHDSPPPQLLVAMARCYIAPEKPQIFETEAISLIKQAIAITPYIEAVDLLLELYKSI